MAEMIWVRRCVKYAVLTVLVVIQDMVDVPPRFSIRVLVHTF